MKSKHRKYNNGGPVKPKKRKKEFTDRSEFLNRLSAYNDSLYAANTSEAVEAYFDEVLGDYRKYQQGIVDHDSSDRVSYADLWGKNSNIVGKPYDLNVTATKDNFVAPSALDRIFGDDQLKVSATNRQLNYKNYQLKNPQKPVERYTYQPPSVLLSDTKYSLSSNDDRIEMRTYKDGDNKGDYMNPKKNPFWRYNHRYTLEDNIYDLNRSFTIDKFQQPNVEPVYTGKSVNPIAENQLKAIKSSGEYTRKTNEKTLVNPMPKIAMTELPPKLPFGNMELNKVPTLRNVLPEIYGRKMNQQTGDIIYNTSFGDYVTTKDSNRLKALRSGALGSRYKNKDNVAPMLDQDFQNFFRSQIEKLRNNRR